MLAERSGLNMCHRKLHTLDKTIQDFEDRLWDMYDDLIFDWKVDPLTQCSEEHLMGERLDDGRIYVKRRVDRSPNRSPR